MKPRAYVLPPGTVILLAVWAMLSRQYLGQSTLTGIPEAASYANLLVDKSQKCQYCRLHRTCPGKTTLSLAVAQRVPPSRSTTHEDSHCCLGECDAICNLLHRACSGGLQLIYLQDNVASQAGMDLICTHSCGCTGQIYTTYMDMVCRYGV